MKTVIPRPHARGPRPHTWLVGPDQVLHEKYKAFVQQRNQARWRGEDWHLEFETWCDLWQDTWDQRGRLGHEYCMTRRDPNQPWDEHNAIVTTRQRANAQVKRKPRRSRRFEHTEL